MKPRFRILYIIVFLHSLAAIAQPAAIIAAPAEKQVMLLLQWYRNDLSKLDSQQVLSALTEAENLFDKKGLTLLRRQAWMMQYLYPAQKNPDAAKAALLMLEAAEKGAKKGWTLTEAECRFHAGNFYFVAGNFGLAYEYMKKALIVFERYDPIRYPHLLGFGPGIAGYYYRLGEYALAIKYLKKTMELPAWWNAVLYPPNLKNTVGLCYQQLKEFDSAENWFHQSYQAAESVQDSFYMALANGNLGYTFFLQGKYDLALPLVETDYKESSRAGETGSTINAGMLLASIHIKRGEIPAAENYMQQCRSSVYASKDAGVLKSWYENLYHIYRYKGDMNSTNRWADSLLMYKDSATALRDKRVYSQSVLKMEAEQHLNEVNQLEDLRKRQLLLRNSLLAILLLSGIIAMLWVNRRLLKRNKEKQLAEQQLEFAQQELLNYTNKLKEKNELLEQLRREIDIQQDGSERIENINRLLSATILTDEDWKIFRELFIKVYPDFFIRLKEKMSDLSPADTRLLALTKLGLPPKDMAAMLGISYEAIKKARQRLRKKIRLPEEGGLEELVEMI